MSSENGSAKEVLPFGEWPSPISVTTIGGGRFKQIAEMKLSDDGSLWWVEQESTGRRALRRLDAGKRDPRTWAHCFSVQNSVHEYGGGSFAPMPKKVGGVLFASKQGVYWQKDATQQPKQILEVSEQTRFADFDVSPCGKRATAVWEKHEKKEAHAQPTNSLVIFDIKEDSTPELLSEGHDFYASPRFSANGNRLVWMAWNHNNMPWDATEIWTAEVDDRCRPVASSSRRILGGPNNNVNFYCPTFDPATGKILVVSDQTDWWNVYELDEENGKLLNRNEVNAEIGYPLWQFGDRPYASNGKVIAMIADDRLMVQSGDSVWAVPGTTDYSYFSHISIEANENNVYCLAYGPKRSHTLLKIALDIGEKTAVVSAIRQARAPEELDELPISVPRKLEFESDGHKISGYFYAPTSFSHQGPENELPPCLILGHAGPTARAYATLDLRTQFFTSRGWAVFDVNYRGSTGFGRRFRDALYEQWGVVDRDDIIAAANYVAQEKLVDEKKICLRGSSAGGFLLLTAALKAPETFAAAVSLYGVSDLEGLVKDSHKFEAGYNVHLVGRLPEDQAIYDERSPIKHVDKIATAVGFFHGQQDTVVPWQQSKQFYEALKAKGVPTALVLFENEGHGFRSAEAVKESTEGGYVFLSKVLGLKPSVESDIVIDNLPSANI